MFACNMLMKRKNRLFLTLVLVGLAIFVAVAGISLYVGWNLTHPPRQAVQENPLQYGMKYQGIAFKSELDGLGLKGWYIPSENADSQNASRTIIFVHGYNSMRSMKQIGALKLSSALHSRNYNLLLFDLRNSGESEESVTSIGAFEKYDLLSAIRFVKAKKPSGKIALIGWSMGAVTAILAAGECADVQAVVADSPFADLEEYLKLNLRIWSGLPNFPFTPIIMHSIPVIEGIDLSTVSPRRAVANLKKHQSLFLIHSRADEDISYENSVMIHKLVPKEVFSELWITEKVEHIRSYPRYREEYETRVINFLDASLR